MAFALFSRVAVPFPPLSSLYHSPRGTKVPHSHHIRPASLPLVFAIVIESGRLLCLNFHRVQDLFLQECQHPVRLSLTTFAHGWQRTSEVNWQGGKGETSEAGLMSCACWQRIGPGFLNAFLRLPVGLAAPLGHRKRGDA
eukprot:scaffold183649_cov44-Tisochrysis_lutea.AAC.2